MSSRSIRTTQTGVLVVISGPSGAGKTSICKALLDRLPGSVWSVSATTRPPRSGETHGTSYEFITGREFAERIRLGDFLEYAEYIGYQYGTPRQPVEAALREGRDVIMEIDVQGGIQVAEKIPNSVRVFVLPPNVDSLRARLEGRNTEAEEQLVRRLSEADGEIAAARDSGCYAHFVVNDVLETTIEQVRIIIEKERRKP